jgi:hypothetical protein
VRSSIGNSRGDGGNGVPDARMQIRNGTVKAKCSGLTNLSIAEFLKVGDVRIWI